MAGGRFVKNFSLLNPPPLFVEIGASLLQAVRENDGVKLPLERQADGRLTPPCRENVIAALKQFLDAKGWQPRAQAFCAVNSRGVSLRRLSLPGGARDEFEQRLLLQIEAEFPLAPGELAWGYQSLTETKPSNGTIGRQDVLVAAVKKEVVSDYHEMLRACGTEPVFTLAALARRQLCGRTPASFAMLDIGIQQSELTFFEQNAPAGSRQISWGSDNPSPGADQLDALTQAINGNLGGKTIVVSGQQISADFTDRLARALGNGCECERLEPANRGGGSAAISGLQKFAEQGEAPPLQLRLEPGPRTATSFANLDWKKWGVRVGALLAAVLLLPYAEAIFLKSHLAKKVAAFKTEAARLTVIDRELDFLRDLKQSQPPYIEVLSVLAKSVPPGTRFDALSLNSHGEVSLRCAFHDGQQVADFRTKLIASGFFTNVVVEEQVPTPDRQRVNVRMSAQEEPLAQLQALAATLPAEETGKDAKPTPPGGLPPGTLPPGGVLPGGTSAPPVVPPVLRKEPK
jgi:Tfp pilus assembly PilM family ATPase